MSEQLFSSSLGFAIENETVGTSVFQQFTVDGLPGDAGLPAAQVTLSNNAPVGSKSVDTTTGFEYRKKTAGSGTDKWVRIADTDDIIASGGTESWREPALVKEDTVYANLAAAEVAVNTGSVDGTVVVEDSRILFTAITGEGKNVFIVTGTPGAGATLVEDANAETNNDAIIIDDGTFAGNQFNYNSTSDSWIRSNQTSLDELAFLRTFVGKDAAGSELPGYTSTTHVANNDTLEVAIGKLDAAVGSNDTDIGTNATSIGNVQTEVDNIEVALGDMVDVNGDYVAHSTSNYIDGNSDVTEDLLDLDTQVKANADAIGNITNDDTNQNAFIGKTGLGAETPTYSSTEVVTASTNLESAIGELDAFLDQTNHAVQVSGVTTLQVIDSVLVDDVKAVRWLIHAQQGTKVITYEIDATHDGTNASDATATDFTKYARLKMNGNIVGIAINVRIQGATTAQTMELTVVATSAVEVSSSRLSVL